MAPQRQIGHSIITEALDRYAHLGNLTLAKLLFKRHPLVWASLDTCRSAVRRLRGCMGERDRKYATHHNPLTLTDGLPLSDAKPWLPCVLDDAETALVLPDVHVPYHDVQALTAALQHGIKAGVREAKERGAVIIDGDFADFYHLSKFMKDPDARNFAGERDMCVSVLSIIREMYPDARIIYKLGNHDDRLSILIKTRAPEFYGCDDFTLPKLFKLDDFGIEAVDLKRPIYLSHLNILHGHEFWTSFTNPVNPARGAFLKTKDCCMIAHQHQTSMHTEPTLRGKSLTCWSLGCLCDLHPQYMPFNKWNHGFAIVKHCPDFRVDNLRIMKGEVI